MRKDLDSDDEYELPFPFSVTPVRPTLDPTPGLVGSRAARRARLRADGPRPHATSQQRARPPDHDGANANDHHGRDAGDANDNGNDTAHHRGGNQPAALRRWGRTKWHPRRRTGDESSPRPAVDLESASTQHVGQLDLFELDDPGDDDRERGRDVVHADLDRRGTRSHMGTHAPVNNAIRLQGLALTIYFVLLPYVVVTTWSTTYHVTRGDVVRALLVVLATLWCIFVISLVRAVIALRRGGAVRSGATWIAALILSALPFLISSSAEAASFSHTPPITLRATHHTQLAPAAAGLPLVLMAKRRRDDLRKGEGDASEVDDNIELLRHLDESALNTLRDLIGDELCGVVNYRGDDVSLARSTVDPVVVIPVGPSPDGLLVAFAREGGVLSVASRAPVDEIAASVTTLHAGPVEIATEIDTLLRLLATRHLRNAIVLYLGPETLDADLAQVCVTLRTPPSPSLPSAPTNSTIRVEVLRAEPRVTGLVEPFLPTLRRRCVEMTTYLALHRHEPITGDRLRSRVLGTDTSDVSSRTLANTASAIRRSLGVDDDGPRLHPVSAAGLYATHDVTSDLEDFTTMVATARSLGGDEAATLCERALALVRGEPLASALKGFEWFLAEGFAARLARDGEWAALFLAHDASRRGDHDTAFWALQQGLLVDPYSDALRSLLARVPRLREFGGDRGSRAKDQAVSSSRAVAATWSLAGLHHQITQ